MTTYKITFISKETGKIMEFRTYSKEIEIKERNEEKCYFLITRIGLPVYVPIEYFDILSIE